MSDESQQKSYKLVWIAGSSFAVLVVIVGLSFILVSQSTNKHETSASASLSAGISKAEVSKNISDLNASLNKSKAEAAAAKTALDDSKNQVKLAN